MKWSKSIAKRQRRNHSPAFNGQVAIAALKDDKTLAELAQLYDVHPNRITDWKTSLMEMSAHVFADNTARAAKPEIKMLHAKMGQLTLENDFLGTR